MSNEAIAEHILYTVHKYDEDWNNTLAAYNQKVKWYAIKAFMSDEENLTTPEQPTKPPATVLLDRIKATLEHYDEQTN